MPLQIKNVSVCVIVALRITEKTEKRLIVKFCQNLRNICTETYDIIKMAFGEDSVCRAQVLGWFHCFKEERTSVESDAKCEARHNGCLQFSSIKKVLCLMSSLQTVTQ